LIHCGDEDREVVGRRPLVLLAVLATPCSFA
jgi:hypothetical protein